MGAGTRTAWQHDPRVLSSGAISIFDNGSSPTVHGQARGIVRQPRRAASHRDVAESGSPHTPAAIRTARGTFQALAQRRLARGLVPDALLLEFDASGALLFDAHFPAHTQSYRSFRAVWRGTPTHVPAFAFSAAAGGAGTVYASWNGATLVSGWRVLSGASPGALSAIAQVARTGFETAIALPPGAVRTYLTVEALDASGAVIGTAQTARV